MVIDIELTLNRWGLGKISENKFQFLCFRFSKWKIPNKYSISFEINWRVNEEYSSKFKVKSNIQKKIVEVKSIPYGVSMKAIIFNKEGKLLTIFRTETAPTRPNTWDLPGGDLDFGEEPNKAIIREIKEETGLVIDNIKIFDVEAHINQEGIHWVTFCFKCTTLEEEIILSHEHNNYKWVTQEEFLNLESSPKLQRFVCNVIKI